MTSASSTPPRSGERLRVLLVEDSPQVRRSMARVLNTQFTVVEADDGDVAVNLVRESQLRGEMFDVVVTDLEMPKMNGREALEEISKIAPLLAARSIVVTGGAKDPQLAAWLESLPAERVISKPTDGETLRKAIYDLVG